MDFQQAIDQITEVLSKTGTSVDSTQYDGIIVKRLEASITLDDNRTTNQTHIAITGAQMDIFPYLRSDGYFNELQTDTDLKKYFITQIPVTIYESNISYLCDEEESSIIFSNGIKKAILRLLEVREKNRLIRYKYR